jgi:2-furoyl-CoA dehydrogenase FAD binding subunit
MKPKQFDFVRAESLSEALACLAEHGDDARILAGGQSQVAMLNFRLIETKLLIDIVRIDELDYIRIDNGALEVGAAVRQADLKDWPELAETVPLVHAALPHLGHFQTRNQGTVCGSIAHSDPSSELPLCLATLDGEVVLQSQGGRRTVKAGDFQVDLLTTDKRSDEMITAVRFPLKAPGTGYAFDEMNRRRGDFAIVSLAAAVSENSIRLGVGGVAATPTVRDWPGLDDAGLDDSGLDDALNAFAWDLGGDDDIHATGQYRRELVRRLGRRTIMEANKCRC